MPRRPPAMGERLPAQRSAKCELRGAKRRRQPHQRERSAAERLTGRPHTQPGAARRPNKLTSLCVLPCLSVCAGRGGVLRQDPEAHSGARGLLSIRALLCADRRLRTVRLGGLTHIVLCVGCCCPRAAQPRVRVREISGRQIDQGIQLDTHSRREDFLGAERYFLMTSEG